MRSSGRSSALRQMTQPTPGYTSPYLWPEALIDFTRSSAKSQASPGSRNGATKPPDAASTCSGTSGPPPAASASRAAAISCTGS